MSKTRALLNSNQRNHQIVGKQSTTTATTTTTSNTTKRKNRKNITLGLKLEIIQRLEQGQSNSSICQEYHLPSSTVSTIRSKKEQIKEFCKNSAVQNQYYQISYPRNNIIEEVEISLYEWIKEKKFQVETVKYHEIRDKALEFFEEAKRKSPQDYSDERIDFKASHGWFDRFRKRFSLKSRTTTTSNCKLNNNFSHNNSNNNNNNHIDNEPMSFDQHVVQNIKNHSKNGQAFKILAPAISSPSPSASSSQSKVMNIITAHTNNNNNDNSCNNNTTTIMSKCLQSIDEPITVIEEANDQIMTKDNFNNDIMELFWGKVVSSIFTMNEKVHNNTNGNQNTLDAKSLAIVFKLSEGIINILESRDQEKKRFLIFKQNLAHILHPYREIYNRELSNIRETLKKNIYTDDLDY